MKSTISKFIAAIAIAIQTGCGDASVTEVEYAPTTYTVQQQNDGICIAIVYDTSGSMGDGVQNKDGVEEPKYAIANRSLEMVTQRLVNFSKANPSKPIEACLITFGNHWKINLSTFNPKPFINFANSFHSPDGGTPLGGAIQAASATLLQSPLKHRHIIVITDGGNNVGPSPEAVFPEISRKGVGLNVIAFDVSSFLFDAIKKQGATVVGSSNEVELNAQLTNILKKRVLLEDAE